MNTTDKIITALTPGSIFNRNGLIFRSLSSLAGFAGEDEGRVLELLNGDLAMLVTCKPSKEAEKGILVALTERIPQPVAEQAPVQEGEDPADRGDLNEIEAHDVPIVEVEIGPHAQAVEDLFGNGDPYYEALREDPREDIPDREAE